MTTVTMVTLTAMTCSTCGCVYGLNEEFRQARKADGQAWYAPCGHGACYRETDLVRERRARERAELRAENERRWKEAAQRSAISLRGVVTRTKRRIAAGKCPCCKTEFGDLQGHMAQQHPDYAGEGR